jgi:hypothetical protein
VGLVMANALSSFGNLGVAAPMAARAVAPVEPSGNALKPMATPQMSPYAAPKKPMQNALLGSAVDGFMRGFAPQQREADIARRKGEGMDKMKQTLALIEQQRALPMEQRAQWWQANADGIGQIIGQDVRSMPVDPNQFTDEALDGHRAMLSAQLGIAPEKPPGPDYQFLQGPDGAIARGDKTSGGLEVMQPGAPKAADPVKYVTEQVGDRIIAYNPMNPKETMDMGPAPPKGGGGSDGEPSAYQLWQMQRAEAEDARKADDKAAIEETAVMNLRDGQERLRALTNHAGFKGIYGPFGAFGINAGAKPTNIMNQDELNAMAMLDQIGGEAFLAGVQKMRGTGPLSDNEGKRVSAAVTRLTNRMQSPEAAQQAAQEFMASMRALEQAYMKESGGAAMPSRMDDVESSGIFDDVMDGAANMFGGVVNAFTGGGRQQPVRVGSKEQRDALPPGTRYIAPDGSVKVKK